MITGVTNFSTDVTEKYPRVVARRRAEAAARRCFWAIHRPDIAPCTREAVRRSVAQHSVEARFAEVASPEEIEPAISRLAKEGAQALVVCQSPMFRVERRRIVKLALAQRWPVVAGRREFAEAGALLSYGADRSGELPPRRLLRGPDPEGREAGRPADRAADEVRAGRQPARRRRALGLTHPAVVPDARGQGDRVTVLAAQMR